MNPGPLIGILTSKSKAVHSKYTGNTALFIRIQQYLHRKDCGFSIVFTPQDVHDNKVNGIIYHHFYKKWLSMQTPLPDIVYNRIPFREQEEEEKFLQLKTLFQEKRIPFFNACFFSKWDVYNSLASHSKLKQFLPETIYFQNHADLHIMLMKHRKLYVKPTHGHQGNGIFLVELSDEGEVSYSSQKSAQKFASLDEFLEKTQLEIPLKSYILQEAIPPDTLSGKRYDLRIFAHLNHGNFIISGIGVRQSGDQQITTHVPNGGRIIPFSSIQHRFDLFQIEQMIDQCGKQLTTKYGLIGEFSVDVGLSKSGKLFIFEINSKPMVFDEPDIKENGLKNLVSLFYELTEFC